MLSATHNWVTAAVDLRYCTQTVTALLTRDSAIRYTGTWPDAASGTRALICQRPGYWGIGPLNSASAGVSPK